MTDKISQITEKMIAYDRGDIRRIEHFMKVYGYAAVIGKLEGLDPDIQEYWKRPLFSMISVSRSAKKNTTAVPENIRK